MAGIPSPTKIYHHETYPSISPTRPELSAKGKSVLITGGGSGIGAETARHFAAAGASRIAIVGRRPQPLLDTKASIESQFPGVEVTTVPTDATKKEQVDAAFAQFAANGHAIDVLVSNAADVGPLEAIRDVDPEALLGSVDRNVRMSLFVAQAFLRHAAPEGAVAIDVNSSAAHYNFGAGHSAYNVSKMAIARLWDALAFGNPQISVFHIQPGIVDTDMNKEAGGAAKHVAVPDNANLPASFSVWLASPEAKFLRSKFLWANWDVDELKARAREIESSELLSIGLGGWPFGFEGRFEIKFD